MKLRRSTLIPIMLLIYLAVMSYVGRHEFYSGNYLFYFGIIGITLIVILLVHLSLKRRERNN